MTKPTLIGLMIGLVLIGMVAAILGSFIAELGSNYDVNTENINLSKYNKMNEISEQTTDIQNKTLSIDQPTGIIDIVGGFFYNAYKVITGIPSSFDLFNNMVDEGTSEINIPLIGTMKNALLTIVLLLIIGTVLALLVKKDII